MGERLGSDDARCSTQIEYERRVNSEFTWAQSRRTIRSGRCRTRERPAVAMARSIDFGESHSMMAMVTRAYGRTLPRAVSAP
jgi:hypothetical protein